MCTPPGICWRIFGCAGYHIEESHEEFETIAAALAKGTKRRRDMDLTDRSVPASRLRSGYRPRGR